MTARNHIVFQITIIAFLAASLTFIPGCGGDDKDEDSVSVSPEMLKQNQTDTNLQLLAQALTNHKYVFLPEDTSYEGGVADNSHLIEALEEYGIDEKILKDGWGNDIYYDNLRDETGEPDINRTLPDNPIAGEFPSFELSDEEKDRFRWDFVVWSRGPDIEDKSDNISRRGIKNR